MKLYKLSILALALAGTMVACSDDDDYTAAVATPGAFFPSTAPAVVELPQEGNSVDIPISRTGTTGDQTFNLTVTDASGLFNIPSTVSFTGNETSSLIHVTYSSEQIVQDKAYPVTIVIEGSTCAWGNSTYEFSFERITPLEVTDLGVGQYIYAAYISGYSNNEVQKIVNATTPNIETYVVKNWFNAGEDCPGVDLHLILHKDIILPNGYPYVEMQWIKINYVNPNYAAIKIIGTLEFCMFRFGLTFDQIVNEYHYSVNTTSGYALTPETVSYYDPERGTFHIFDRAGAFDEEDKYLGGWDPEAEYLYLPGYPEYDVEISYLGYFTGEDESMKAIGEVYAGADVETVDVYNIEGDDVEAALALIETGGAEAAASLAPEGEDATKVTIDIPGPGTYTMIAVAIGDGEIQGYDYSTYTISGAPAVKWEAVGTGVYTDGWLLPAYSITNAEGQQEQVNPFNYPWNVQIEKNPDVEGEYRMVSPYTQSGFALVGQNQNTKPTNIIFNIADPDWPYVAFQASGFSDGDMLWISDFNWFCNNVQGYTKEQILNSNLADRASYYENNVLEITRPLFAMSGNNFSSSLDDLGYSWNGPGEDKTPYPTRLTMPSGTKAQTVAKALKRQVSNDDFVRSIHASKVKVEKNNRKSSFRLNDKVTMNPVF